MSTDVATYKPSPPWSPRARHIALGIWFACIAVVVSIAVSTGHWRSFLIQLPLYLLFPLSQWGTSRRTFRADADGIHARPVLEAPWSTIESVKKPTQWDPSTMVRMRGTGEERSSGFPTSYAEQLARIGDKPLV